MQCCTVGRNAYAPTIMSGPARLVRVPRRGTSAVERSPSIPGFALEPPTIAVLHLSSFNPPPVRPSPICRLGGIPLNCLRREVDSISYVTRGAAEHYDVSELR